ncbi:hypothetical protein B046DRAFT_00241 [Streptomyces sp. LamerLS-316]|uniref:hypothetical protein n=1 Tax=unclassified Streptomyces TaxID=2593676 RepID=UPI000823C4ED|nr:MULTISPECIES: hypothetical protein [unclassified Streptomyces]MYQ40905.1 hypothetical protein [Streptomyces sp. SID4921]SCK06331.1 hypothetical protein B046DRAFT_00241 [Streptomyces sp. LamerLS-316]
MTTVVIIVAVVLVAALALLLVRSRGTGGRGLRHRFGPEYDRTVARHDGDTKAAEHELSERVKLHGSLTERPLRPEAREAYALRWAEVQEQFIDSPREAVVEADALLAQLAQDRGFPGADSFEEQTAALSVHHAEQVDGYRRVHTAVRGQGGTEEMRKALIESRALFDVLLADAPGETDRTDRNDRTDRHETKGSAAA